jgi:hypothetical protein
MIGVDLFDPNVNVFVTFGGGSLPADDRVEQIRRSLRRRHSVHAAW